VNSPACCHPGPLPVPRLDPHRRAWLHAKKNGKKRPSYGQADPLIAPNPFAADRSPECTTIHRRLCLKLPRCYLKHALKVRESCTYSKPAAHLCQGPCGSCFCTSALADLALVLCASSTACRPISADIHSLRNNTRCASSFRCQVGYTLFKRET